MRAFLDANVLVSAAIRPHGKPDQIVRRAVTEFDWLTSEYVLSEVARALSRSHIQKKYAGLVTRENQALFFGMVRQQSEMLDTGVTIAPVSRDINDDPILVSATYGNADYIVTGDRDLLVLGEFEGIQIVTPEQFLQILDEIQDD